MKGLIFVFCPVEALFALLPSFVCALHSSPQLDTLLSLRSGLVDDPTAEVGEAPEALCL